MASDIHVLGVDPGFASFGWCVVRLGEGFEEVRRVGVFRTAKSAKKSNVKAVDDNFRRAAEIAHDLHQQVEMWKPVALVAEAMSFPRNASASAKVALAWGVLADLSVVHNLSMAQATPQEIKIALCRSKSATKVDVQKALEARYPDQFLRFTKEEPRGDWEHGFDAVGAVVACLETDVLRMARRMGGL